MTVLDRHDNWVQVADGSGKIGWLSRKQVEVLPAHDEPFWWGERHREPGVREKAAREAPRRSN